MYLEDNLIIRLIPLPNKVEAITLYKSDDDTFNIYVNDGLMGAKQNIALEHELFHIKNGDYFSEQCVGELEISAHENSNLNLNYY